jgi:iduronate 2-sulfatase
MPKHNHAVRSDRWRYIRYQDGGEELYDHRVDPHEWRTLAGVPQYACVIAEHARWLVASNAAVPAWPSPCKGNAKKVARP